MKKSKIKVMTIVGTRPEIIRLSRVMALLDQYVNHILVHTGQNYDYELNEIFFQDLEIRKPEYFLEVDTSTLGTVMGETLIKSEKILKEEMPDAVLILGDTNSSIAGIMAKRLKIPIYHMEAGNRSFDQNVPEEINRRIIDHTADFNLVYTEHARRHLLSEGLPHRRIYLTGSPMYEILKYYKDRIDQSDILSRLELEKNNYFLISTHREENVDYEINLISILKILNHLAEEYKIPIIVSTHPRTKKQLENLQNIKLEKLIKFLKPFGFSDYIHLQQNAKCVLSDSGTISEESAILSFPAISIRNSMERPEAQDAGTIFLTGFDKDTVLDAVKIVISQFDRMKYENIPLEYRIDNTSWRVLKLIVGTHKLSHIWDGIQDYPSQ